MSYHTVTKACCRRLVFLVWMFLILGTSISTSAQSPLYQLHRDGKIWQYTGTPCSGNFCPGWQMLDNNAATKAIVSDGALLYQLHENGKIWQYTGTPCNGDDCFGWQMLDNNPATAAIVADSTPLIHDSPAAATIPVGSLLYQLHKNGLIFRFTGTPCNGDDCFGWQMLDNNPATKLIAAGGGQLFQLHKNGKVWRHTGTPCNGDNCPGWQMLHNGTRNSRIASDGVRFYRLEIIPSFHHSVRRIWRFTGTPCSGDFCPGWEKLDSNRSTTDMVGNRVEFYQRRFSGHIFRFNGTPCSGTSCPGWIMLDNNPNTLAITSR